MSESKALRDIDPDWTARFDHFEIELRNAIAVVRINRPSKLNALGLLFWSQLTLLLAELEADSTTRVVVITGAGERAFSAGGDIVSFGSLNNEAAMRRYMTECMNAFAAIETSPLPIIAAVNGLALGGGCELAFACDIVLASEAAEFGLPETAIGLVPGFGVLRGPSVIGRQWTKFMVLTGERIGATRAFELGIVQQIVPKDRLMEDALLLAERVAAQAPLAVAEGKRLINHGIDHGEAQLCINAVSMLQATSDFAEGRLAFEMRRTPKFEAC